MPRFSHWPPDEILLVEDQDDDADLMIGELKMHTPDIRVNWVEDGAGMLSYLNQRYADSPSSPERMLILLDNHLPGLTGCELLAEIERDAALRNIPIVLLIGNHPEQALHEAYPCLRAVCCLSKPADQDGYARAVQQLEAFWRRLPPDG
jgi:CheY-like chemotaxis protein